MLDKYLLAVVWAVLSYSWAVPVSIEFAMWLADSSWLGESVSGRYAIVDFMWLFKWGFALFCFIIGVAAYHELSKRFK
jgi:hypothetical protein